LLTIAQRTHLASLLAALPADQREAIRARVLEERPYGEIGGELRLSPPVLRKRVSRGLRTLKSQLQEPK
jgi:RNA polymerase sigma factor (sigma-70 family)